MKAKTQAEMTATETQIYPGAPATRFQIVEFCQMCGGEWDRARDLFAINFGGRPCHRECYDQFVEETRQIVEWTSKGTAIEIREGRHCYEVRWPVQQNALGLCDSRRTALEYAVELRRYRFPGVAILDHTEAV